MKSLIAIIILTSGIAHAYCPPTNSAAEFNQCVQIQQMQQQIQQQQELQRIQSYQAQQPSNIRQQCYRNVYGVVECR